MTPPADTAAPLRGLEGLKGRLPFRVGTTSYIIPDAILPNVTLLAPLVDDIELVLFESDRLSNLPTPAEVSALRGLARAHGISYTVHLPIDLDIGAADTAARRAAVDACLRTVQRTAPLEPFAWILHFPSPAEPHPDSPSWTGWRRALRESAAALARRVPAPARRVAVEILSYPYGWVEDIVRDAGFSTCVDIGHVLLAGADPLACLERYRDATTVFHVHGLRGGRDHRDAGALSPALLDAILGTAATGGPRVVTLEVFNAADFAASLRAVRAWAEVSAGLRPPGPVRVPGVGGGRPHARSHADGASAGGGCQP